MLDRGPLFGHTKLEILVEKCHMFMFCAMHSNGNTRSTYYLILKTFIYVNLLTLSQNRDTRCYYKSILSSILVAIIISYKQLKYLECGMIECIPSTWSFQRRLCYVPTHEIANRIQMICNANDNRFINLL